jgi:hypothetical protein
MTKVAHTPPPIPRGHRARRVADGPILASANPVPGSLDHDQIGLNRIMISSLGLGVIPSENRLPLFRIMLQQARSQPVGKIDQRNRREREAKQCAGR